jgi:hypothetical protein
MCEECQQQSLGAIQRHASVPETPTHVPQIVRHVLGSSGQPLDPATRAFFEPRFGRGLSGVRIHTGPEAAASARAINAHAYTAGSDIVFGPGRFVPEAHEGRRLIAHELAHVMQQSGDAAFVQRQVAHGAGDEQAPEEAQDIGGLTTEELEKQADEKFV